MAKIITPLSPKVPIVDKDGNPTAYFNRILAEISDAKISASVIDAMGGDPGGDRVVVWDGATNDLAFMTISEALDFITGASHGDILYRDSTGWETLNSGTAGQLLQTNGAGADPTWVTPTAGGTDYLIIKCYPGLPNSADTVNVNSTTYVDWGAAAFFVDLNEFLFTEYRIVFSAGSNQAGQTITAQLTYQFAPGSPIHTGGNDVVISNTFGTKDSGWRSKDDALTSGVVGYTVALKGSNATVDLAINSLVVMLRK